MGDGCEFYYCSESLLTDDRYCVIHTSQVALVLSLSSRYKILNDHDFTGISPRVRYAAVEEFGFLRVVKCTLFPLFLSPSDQQTKLFCALSHPSYSSVDDLGLGVFSNTAESQYVQGIEPIDTPA
jgi:hypothetical protein